MIDGFSTKEDIRKDWEQYLGKETSDFAVGSERIFYWLFNQFGQPNSSPIGSDLFLKLIMHIFTLILKQSLQIILEI